jgi:hypothetical protein
MQLGSNLDLSHISKVFAVDDIFILLVHISTLAKLEMTHCYLQQGSSALRHMGTNSSSYSSHDAMGPAYG